MARKKAASKSNASSGESTQRASAEDGGGDGAATAAAATTTSVPVEDLTLEQLRSELQSARSELAVLRAQLGASAPATPPDVQALSDRLAALRREQEEADAARDKAWQQLKVGDGAVAGGQAITDHASWQPRAHRPT
jgi:DNA repair exonuclease SbcCD ATPase subunit